jgi:hypothetical protein
VHLCSNSLCFILFPNKKKKLSLTLGPFVLLHAPHPLSGGVNKAKNRSTSFTSKHLHTHGDHLVAMLSVGISEKIRFHLPDSVRSLPCPREASIPAIYDTSVKEVKMDGHVN